MRSAKAFSSTAASTPAFNWCATSAFNLNSRAKSNFATASALAKFGHPPTVGMPGTPFPWHPATVEARKHESETNRRKGRADGRWVLITYGYPFVRR